MTSPEQSDEYQQLLENCKPGAAIKFYRESKTVSIQEIARETLIPDWKLRDLENDSYDGLGADLFVVGYLRTVSKLLQLDSDALVDSFNRREKPQQVVEEVPDEPVIGRYAPPPKPTPKPSLVSRFAGVSGVLVVALLVLSWVLIAQFTKGPQPQQPSEAPAQAAQAPQQPEAKQQPETIQEPELQPDSPAVALDVLEPTPVSAAVEALPTAVPALKTAVETQAPARPAVAVAPTAVPTAPPMDAAPPIQAAAPAPTMPPAEPASIALADSKQDLLAIAFSDDCWVQVSDASGEVRIAQLKRTGDNLQLFGEAPFDVKLGNARAADVMINGQSFAFSPIPGRDTLQFTVTP